MKPFDPEDLPDRSTPPVPGPVRPFHLPPVRSDQLDSGLLVRSMSRGHVPLVSVTVVLDAGEATVSEGREGIAILAGDALAGGTGGRSGAELAEAFERLGAGLHTRTGWDATIVSFTCVAERLDAMLGLVSEVVRDPAFPEKEVDRVRSEGLAAIRQRRMDPAALADDALDAEVFGPVHPYCRPLAGTDSSVSGVSRGDILAFVQGRYAPMGGGVAVVGDLTADRVREVVDRHFGSWAASGDRGSRPPMPRIPDRNERTILVVPRPGSVQSEIRIGHAGPARGHEDEVPLRVANAALGGSFTSRLNLSLRERHGFTYGVFSGFAARRDGGGFSIQTAVQTEVTAQAMGEAMDVFRTFAREGPSVEEVERARDYLAGVFPLRMETTAQLASRLAELVIHGLPEDYHHRYRDRIRAVGREDAARAAIRHLDPDTVAIVVVGDPDGIVPGIEGLGLGPVRVAEPT